MDKIDELLEFVNECVDSSDWDQLATAFILPGELEPVEIVIRSVGVRSTRHGQRDLDASIGVGLGESRIRI